MVAVSCVQVTEFLLQDLELLPEEEFPLSSIHFVLCLLVDLAFQLEEPELPFEDCLDVRKSRHWIKHFQRCLTLRKFQIDRGRDHVGKTTGVVDIHCGDDRVLGEVLAQLRTLVKQFNNSFDLITMVADAGRRLFRHDRPDQQERFRVDGL